MTTPKFYQKNGLTVYSLHCGYIQVAKYTDLAGVETEVTLRHEGGNCYTVKGSQYGGEAKTAYLATESIGHARRFWSVQVERLHGERIKAAKADKRYSVTQEFVGEREPLWVARFESGRESWLGKSDTSTGAWLLVAKDKEQRMDIADTIAELEKEQSAQLKNIQAPNGQIDYRAMAFNEGFDITDTEDGYKWSARNFVQDSTEEFATEQEAWENIVANFPNIEV